MRKLTELEGAPGAWAALNLARRREKAYVPRAIEALCYYASRLGAPRGARFNQNLRRRLIVLLSNCAKQSGVPQPPRITCRDPWLPMLAKQRID